MLTVVSYDIKSDKRRRKVALELRNFGVRVQWSVFECHLDEADFDEMVRRIDKIIDAEADRVHYFRLCQKDEKATIVDGGVPKTSDEDYYLF